VRERVIVLKLGGSVLRDEESLPRAVHEIYRWRRAGQAVVAVVSALAGETDRLLERARLAAGEPAPHTAAALAANGESFAAALLAAALDRAGVGCAVLSPAALRLRADGPALDATPVDVEHGRLARALERAGVVLVPGFAGEDALGRTVLLGRGGSDLTALFLAHRLGARCRLVKDVDGLYERDPAAPGPPPRRFERASFADALATDGSIVQHKAVRFARAHELVFELAAPNGTCATRIGSEPSRLEPIPRAARRPLRVALLGLGTVGGGVWRLLDGLPQHFEVVLACTRDRSRAERLGVPAERLASDPSEAFSAGADVVVELLGGAEPARALIASALAGGRDVVTANKRVLAEHGSELRELARQSGARWLGSAAVGGSMPVLEHASRLAPGELRHLRGVLNGTVNFVLGELAGGCDLGQALAGARAKGLCEPDATRDLDGRDAADKLAVLAAALGLQGLTVEREPLDMHAVDRARRAAARGNVLRQVATLEPRAARARVELVELEPTDPLADLPGARNAVVLEHADGSCQRLEGVGAGRWPTAEAVLGDLLELARARRGEVSPPPGGTVASAARPARACPPRPCRATARADR
jgi:homoserine dehydrogenase